LITRSCEGGSSDYDLYLFKEIATKDSLNRIPFLCWLYSDSFYDEMSDGKRKSMLCFSTIKKIENDTLVINYAQEYRIDTITHTDGYSMIGLLETINKEPFDVLYIYKNNQWRIANKEDYEKLKNTCFDMNFYFKF